VKTPEGTTPFPPLLTGLALAFWGWQNQSLEFAVPMALLYELAPFVRWRWRFDSKDFNRLVDLTAVLFVATAIYQFDARAVHGIYGVLQWVPALLYVLLIGQRFSERGRIGLGALFLSIRRALARGEIAHEKSIDFAYPFFGACLLSAMGGVVRSPWMLPLLVVLVVAGLALARPRRHHPAFWLGAVCVAAVVGYASQAGVRAARAAVEPLIVEMMRDYMVSRRDPFRTQTAIGDIGRLKQSEQIEMRIWPAADGSVPSLLREATYRVYSRGTWLAGSQGKQTLRPNDGGLTWTVGDPPQANEGRDVRTSRYLPRGRGVLAVPSGTWQLRNLGVETLEKHRFGALRIVRGPDLVDYVVRYVPGRDEALEPDEGDLKVSPTHQGLFVDLVEDLGLKVLPVGERIGRLREHFATNFSYSLDSTSMRSTNKPLDVFLNDTRSGHCEYFATSTVLALRSAGIPARYAAGYAVAEWSPLDDAFVVRRRHAHSWALAYVDGQWQNVDTTPARWNLLESASPPWWLDAYDLWSWLAHAYSAWRWRTDEDSSAPWILLAVLPLGAFLIWRLRGQRVSTAKERDRSEAAIPGADSPFLRVVAEMHGGGHGVARSETLPNWLSRLQRTGVIEPEVAAIARQALELHERLRFAATTLSVEQYARLGTLCDDWRKWQATPGSVAKNCA
jgi:transglutaminase-like putative cysteine protease